MNFHCVYCGQAIEVPDEAVDRQTTCPGCNAEVSVPLPPPRESPISGLAEAPKPELDFQSVTKLSETNSDNHLIFTLKRFFLYSLLACFVIGALTALISLQSATFGEYQSRILLTTFSFGVYSLTGLCCALLTDNSRGRASQLFGGIGIVASIVGALFAVLTNWEIVTGWEILLRGRFAFFIIAASFAHAALLLLINTSNSMVRHVRNVTVAMIAIVAGLLLVAVINPKAIGYSWVMLGSFAVVDVFGTVATPILHLASRRPERN